MNRNKYIFFDIDGTLLGSNGSIPESALAALDAARANGHRLFIATGRSKGELPAVISEYPFSGWVMGSGAYVEIDGKAIFHEVMDMDKLNRFTDFLEQKGAIFLYETNESCYTDQRGKDYIVQLMTKNSHYRDIADEFINSIHVENCRENIREVNKLVYYNAAISIEELGARFQEDFDILPNSILNNEGVTSGEVSKRGITKAGGARCILKQLGAVREDVIAFGDGYNDMELIRFAGTGVAMGNGVDELKAAADMVAAALEADGINRAMKQLGLI